jgi:hypothetical protein
MLTVTYLISLVSGLYLTGLIWTIQTVHYPSFAYVSKEEFLTFSQFHQKSITYIVAPMMIVELFSTSVLYLQNFGDWKLGLLALSVVLVWASTFALSVPLHNQLTLEGYNIETIQQLVKTNWPRTILWSLKSIAMVLLLRSYVI